MGFIPYLWAGAARAWGQTLRCRLPERSAAPVPTESSSSETTPGERTKRVFLGSQLTFPLLLCRAGIPASPLSCQEGGQPPWGAGKTPRASTHPGAASPK